MYAIFTMRKLQLTERINQLQFKLMKIMQKQQDLAVYSGNVADGIITPTEFMNSPASIFGVNMNFFNNSVPRALFNASNATNMHMNSMMQAYQMSGGQYGMAVDITNPSAIFGNQAFIFNAYFKQALEAAGKAEAANIKRLEKNIDAEKLQIETQLKAAEAELQEVVKAEENGIKNSAPKYA